MAILFIRLPYSLYNGQLMISSFASYQLMRSATQIFVILDLQLYLSLISNTRCCYIHIIIKHDRMVPYSFRDLRNEMIEVKDVVLHILP